MMRVLADYIMRGRKQAILIASAMALLSIMLAPIILLSIATVALVTLRLGSKQGAIVLTGSAIATAILGYFTVGSYLIALLFALLFWLPIWVVAIVLRESRRLEWAVEIAVFIGMLGVAGFYLYFDNPAGIWSELIEQFKPFKTMTLQMKPPNVGADDWITEVSQYVTGMFAAGAVFSLLFGLFLARWWQSLLYNPGGFKHEFLLLNTSPKLALSSVGILVIAIFVEGTISEIAWNMVIVLFALYAVIGTSVLHVVLSQTKLKTFAVPLFYATLFLVPQVLPPVAVVGLIDAWLNIRKNKSNQTSA